MSMAEKLSMLSPTLQEEELAKIAPTTEDREALLYSWDFWKRPNQEEPDGNWGAWAIFSGRGYGKTRIGSESVIKRARHGPYFPIALIGQTKADTRDTMVELFESSIMKVSPPWFMPRLEVTKRRLVWPNGMIAVMYSGDEPDQVRGPQHGFGWLDELAKFKYPQETWDNFSLGLRMGPTPQAIITTTPRPIQVIKDLVDDPYVVKSYGSTYDNLSNLPIEFIRRILGKYENTRLGAQEIYGKILGDVEGALWKRDVLEKGRVTTIPELYRIVVGVDPPTGGITNVSKGECGIVVAGIGIDHHGYVLEDATFEGVDPESWAKQAVAAYSRYNADQIVAEANQGGKMVTTVIGTVSKNLPVTLVFAAKGKHTRAEPIASLYSQEKIHHVGMMADLEDQLCSWVPGEASPDRLDACVWALSDLMLKDWHGLSIDELADLFEWT